MYVFDHMSLSSFQNENVSDKIVQKIKNTHFKSKDFFFSKIVPFEIMWKNIVEPGLLHIIIWRMQLSMLGT